MAWKAPEFDGKAAARCCAHEQGADQARSGRIGDGVDGVPFEAGDLKAMIDQGQEFPDMVPGGDLGHHAAVLGVQIDLAVQRMREQPLFAVEQGDTRFVAGGFDSQNAHAHRHSLKETGF